jgi:hypothetical protein
MPRSHQFNTIWAFPLPANVGFDPDQPPCPLTAGVMPAFFADAVATSRARRLELCGQQLPGILTELAAHGASIPGDAGIFRIGRGGAIVRACSSS